jgi:hypothetical protein
MTFEEDVISKYQATFNGRLFFDTAPDGWTPNDMAAPFCIIEQIGGDERWFVDNTRSEMQRVYLQFSVWGARRSEVANTARTFRDVAAASNMPDFIVIPSGTIRSDYNEPMKLRGTLQDFIFWHAVLP